MKINSKHTLIAIGLAAAFTVTAGCSSEDAPEVEYHNPSMFFQPADSDNSVEAQMRRKFYADNGSFLLFNDTLQYKFLGTDINGDDQYFIELIDPSYEVGGQTSSTVTYRYTYLTDDSTKQAAVDYVNEYIMPHLNKRLRPFSVFLCQQISVGTYNMTQSPYAVANQRCVLIAMNYLMIRQRTEAQKQTYADRVLNIIVNQAAVNNSSSFTTFFSYSSQYYNVTYGSVGISGTTDEVRRLGFISTGSISGSFPSANIDLQAYTTEATRYSQEELEAKYGEYPVIMNKFAALKSVLTELGYVFN